jgi:hypothetical protein
MSIGDGGVLSKMLDANALTAWRPKLSARGENVGLVTGVGPQGSAPSAEVPGVRMHRTLP